MRKQGNRAGCPYNCILETNDGPQKDNLPWPLLGKEGIFILPFIRGDTEGY